MQGGSLAKVDFTVAQELKDEFYDKAKYRCITPKNCLERFMRRFVEDTDRAIEFLFD